MVGPLGDSSEELPAIPADARPLQSPPAVQDDMFDRRHVTVTAVPRRQAGEREYARQMNSASLEGNADATGPSWSDDSLEVALLRQTMMRLDEDISGFDQRLDMTSMKARILRAAVRCMAIEGKCSQIEHSISIARTRRILDGSHGLPRLRPIDKRQPADGTKNNTECAFDGVVHGASTTNTATGIRQVGHEGLSINMTRSAVTGGDGCSSAKPGGSALRVQRRLVPTMTASTPSTATHGTTCPGKCTFVPKRGPRFSPTE